MSYICPKKRKKTTIILNKEEIKKWGNIVIKKLKKVTDIENDNFIILAGKNYIDPINNKCVPNKLKNIELPLSELKIGQKLKKLNELIEKLEN